MLIDSHVHAYTKNEVEALHLSMKKNKIDKAIIMYWPRIGSEEAPVFNDVIKHLKPYPNIFIAGSITITNPKRFNKYLKEIESAFIEKQIVGVKLYLGYEHFYANDPRCDKVYKLCLKYNAPVIFHTGDVLSKDNTALIKYANPIFIDEVAVKYPKLKMVIAHIGNPCWIKETAEVISKNKNVYADISGLLSLRPDRYERIYQSNLKRQLLELVAYCGAPVKLLFGTDFNPYKHEPYLKFFRSFKEFSKEDLELIKHKNAEYIFGI